MRQPVRDHRDFQEGNVHHINSVCRNVTRNEIELIIDSCLINKKIGPPGLVKVEMFYLFEIIVKRLSGTKTGCVAIRTDKIILTVTGLNAGTELQRKRSLIISVSCSTYEFEANIHSVFYIAVTLIESIIDDLSIFAGRGKFLEIRIVPMKNANFLIVEIESRIKIVLEISVGVINAFGFFFASDFNRCFSFGVFGRCSLTAVLSLRTSNSRKQHQANQQTAYHSLDVRSFHK